MSGPIVILLVLVMLVMPLPPAAISVLFALNISAGLVILAARLYISSPAEFSSFPSVLLATTLMRLALNVATARAILLNGMTGPGAAGKVIEFFGQFAVGGNYVVGGIIFFILIIINFVVVSKGAQPRCGSFSAFHAGSVCPAASWRSTPRSMPVSLSPQAAERRRDSLRREADFFGAMDGASKFVRGDVVAAMIILVVNMLGGLIIGTLQYGLPIGDAARTYTLLTVGDGLAAQIPSLTISIAAGLVVTRVATGEDIGAQIKSQLSKYPQALAIASAITTAIGLVPQMAHIPFLLLGGALGTAAWRLSRAQPEAAAANAAQKPGRGRGRQGRGEARQPDGCQRR